MDKIDSKAEISKKYDLHKKKLKAIQKQNTQQIKKVKQSHTDRLINIDNQNSKSLLSARDEGNQNLIKQIETNETKLQKASENLELTKKAISGQEQNRKLQHYNKMKDFEDVAQKQVQNRQRETNEFVDKIGKQAKQSQEKVREDLNMATWSVRNRAADAITTLTLDKSKGHR